MLFFTGQDSTVKAHFNFSLQYDNDVTGTIYTTTPQKRKHDRWSTRPSYQNSQSWTPISSPEANITIMCVCVCVCVRARAFFCDFLLSSATCLVTEKGALILNVEPKPSLVHLVHRQPLPLEGVDG